MIIIVLTRHATISDPGSAKIVIEGTNVQDNVDVRKLTNVQNTFEQFQNTSLARNVIT